METAIAASKISARPIWKDIQKIGIMKIKEGFRLRIIMGQPTVIGEGAAQVDFNKLITMNSSAAFLWENIVGKEFDPSSLAELLVSEYGIDIDLAAKDAELISRQWIEAGLVE